MRTLRCSFCNKTDAEVSKLVAGPRVFICDECVAVASRLMDGPPAPPPSAEHRSLWRRVSSSVARLLGIGDARRQIVSADGIVAS
jgi:hypothetical protein